MKVITPEFWPPISRVAQWYSHKELQIQVGGTYQKQSFQNRCKIAGVQGVMTLSVPLVGGREQRTLFTKVQIDNSQRWAVQHLRTLRSCYGKAPFFDYYYPGIEQILLARHERLFSLNEAILQQLLLWLKWKGSVNTISDFLLPAATAGMQLVPYVQVFADRQPFYPNLSTLDLFFCLGPAAMQYLQQSGSAMMNKSL